jgi:MFS family permease
MAVAAMFFALGIGVGLWGGASGAILTRAGVDAATFGVLLTVYTGAYLIAMSAGGALAHRFGVDQALSVSAVMFGAALCALLNASSQASVAIALILAGFLGGVVDVLMNAEGRGSSAGLAARFWPGCTPRRRPAWRSARSSAV